MFLRTLALTAVAATAFSSVALAQSQPYEQLRPAPDG